MALKTLKVMCSYNTNSFLALLDLFLLLFMLVMFRESLPGRNRYGLFINLTEHHHR
jgi:hypothetical protein